MVKNGGADKVAKLKVVIYWHKIVYDEYTKVQILCWHQMEFALPPQKSYLQEKEYTLEGRAWQSLLNASKEHVKLNALILRNQQYALLKAPLLAVVEGRW